MPDPAAVLLLLVAAARQWLPGVWGHAMSLTRAVAVVAACGRTPLTALNKLFDQKIKQAALTSPVLSVVRPQPSNDDSRGQEPLQARSRFASLPTGAGRLLVGVVIQLLPIPSY
jgi:hypothetical protein